MDYIDITAVGDIYRSRLPLQERTEPGCPECGMIFEEGKAYGYVCPNMKCPIQPKAT